MTNGVAATTRREVLVFEDLELDVGTGQASRRGTAVRLTALERAVLAVLMAEPHRVLSRSYLCEVVWGRPPDGKRLDVVVGQLRRKVEADRAPRLIHTVRGVGFVLRRQSALGRR